MRTVAAIALATGSVLVVAGCAAGAPAEESSAGTDELLEPIKVGVIVSVTGNFATQAEDFLNGFEAGLSYLTDGTNVVAGHPIEIVVGDDTGDPAVGAAKATEFIGEGVTVLAGPTSSAVALAVADIAVQNDVLYLGGTSGTSDLVGMNPLVFATSGAAPAGSVLTLRQMGDDPEGSSVAYIAQDYAYGQSTVEQTKAILEPADVEVVPYLLPQETTDFLPLTVQMKEDPTDFIMSSWAGAGQDQLFNALGTQGVLEDATFLGSLLLSSAWPAQGAAFGDAIDAVQWQLSYAPGFVENEKDAFLQEYSEEAGHHLEYDDIVGWHAAEFLVKGITDGGADTTAMADAISDFEFEGPGGTVMVRPDDNQVTVSANLVTLVEGSDGTWSAELIEHIDATELEPALLDDRVIR
ncbi:MAG: ABC transporter substrate-binding protein [Aeromicrobium sp.]